MLRTPSGMTSFAGRKSMGSNGRLLLMTAHVRAGSRSETQGSGASHDSGAEGVGTARSRDHALVVAGTQGVDDVSQPADLRGRRRLFDARHGKRRHRRQRRRRVAGHCCRVATAIMRRRRARHHRGERGRGAQQHGSRGGKADRDRRPDGRARAGMADGQHLGAEQLRRLRLMSSGRRAGHVIRRGDDGQRQSAEGRFDDSRLRRHGATIGLFAQSSRGTSRQGGFGRSGHRHMPILARALDQGQGGRHPRFAAFYTCTCWLDL